MSKLKRLATLFLAVLLLGASAASALAADPNLPAYKPVSGISGTIISVGSDTMNNMMALWAEGFRKYYPNVRVEIEGKGSSTAPPALIAGTSQFGPMSREMTLGEIDAFEKAFGYKPTLLRVGLDALAVYVHKDNPIEGLTLAQVDAIFSKTLRCGHSGSIDTWGQPASPATGPTVRSASTVATPPPALTDSLRRTPSAAATTKIPSKSNPVRLPWSKASPSTVLASVTAVSVT